MSRSVSGLPAFYRHPRNRPGGIGAANGWCARNRVKLGFFRADNHQKTAENFVRRLTTIFFPHRTLKCVSSPPQAQEEIGRPQFAALLIVFDLVLTSILGVEFGILHLTYGQDQALSPQGVIGRLL
jgi:hypothetical protein